MKRSLIFFAMSLWACASAPPGHKPEGPAPTPPSTAEPAHRGQDDQGGHHHGQHAHGDHPHGEEPHHGKHGKGPLVHRFDEGPEVWAKRFESPDRDQWQKPAELMKSMGLAAGMKVADLGAGTGYFVPHLSRAVGKEGKVLALDIEPSFIEHIQKRAEKDGLGNVEAKVVTVADPGLGAASVDRILIVNTWHHIPDREAYTKKLVQGLAAKGSVWVVDYTLEAERGPPKEHRLPPSKVAEELASAGLETRVDEKLLPMQYVVVGTKP